MGGEREGKERERAGREEGQAEREEEMRGRRGGEEIGEEGS